jgi:hypothetical protein
MAFRRGTLMLYTGSLDRTLRVYALTPGAAGFVEALFGHQDGVQALDAGRGEVAVSVGARDRTARWWKVADETQLVFRGGGRSRLRDVLEGGAFADADAGGDALPERRERRYVEGSLECVAMVDEGTFVSGGDSGYAACGCRTAGFDASQDARALEHGEEEAGVQRTARTRPARDGLSHRGRGRVAARDHRARHATVCGRVRFGYGAPLCSV